VPDVAPLAEAPSPTLAPQSPPKPAPAVRGEPPPYRDAPSTSPAHDPLAPIVALSAEEKIALFS
jgi:hypothetical protein